MLRPISCVKYIILMSAAIASILAISVNSESASDSNSYNYPIDRSNPAGPPRIINQDSDSLPLSSSMFQGFLPHLSNVDYGFLYEFSSKGSNRSLFFSDTFFPLFGSCQDVFFCQTHYGYNSFYQGGTYENGSAAYRVDGSVGCGYRFILDEPTIMAFGFNGFWDTSQLYGSWWNSWGVGLEMAVGMPRNGLFDFTANNYGNQFQNMQNVANLWRKGNVNFDLEAGYSQGADDGSIDVRFKYNAYQFSLGDNQTINGTKGGVDLSTGDGLLKIGWEIGYDKDKGTYNTIGASLNLGFQVESLLYGQNPITMPESIFMSPERNPRRLLTQKVKRNTNLPDKVITRNGRESLHFELSINGPYILGTGNYIQNSNTSGTWTVTFESNPFGVAVSATNYQITLAGDTTGLTFPLTITVTPNQTPYYPYYPPVPPYYARLFLSPAYDDVPAVVTMNNPGDVVTVDGNPAIGMPEIQWRDVLPATTLSGNFTISAPGVPNLVVNLVSTN